MKWRFVRSQTHAREVLAVAGNTEPVTDACAPLHRLLTPVELPLDASSWRALGPASGPSRIFSSVPLWVFDANTL
jgi:hypothetical protein